MDAQMEIDVYDDPLDPNGWATEPALRALRSAAPESIWQLHPTVLVDDWERYDGPEFPSGKRSVAAVCSRVSEESGMPIDEYLWFDDPPSTTRVACRGVAAARLQEAELGWRFLRAAREATFLRQTNLDDPAAVRDLAESVPGLDAGAFAKAFDGEAADALADPVQLGEGPDRSELPVVTVAGPAGERTLTGRIDDRQLAHAVRQATGESFEPPELPVRAALERYSPAGWLAPAELAALSGRSREAVVEEAREAEGVAEAAFASEPFFRETEFVDDRDA